MIDQECSLLCQRISPSAFRSITDLQSFQWENCIGDLSTRAPNLMALLSKIVSHSDHRNQKKAASSHFPGICMAIAVLLKERNREVCGIQTLISLILFSSHAEKQVCIIHVFSIAAYHHYNNFIQVYRRLNHACLCLSYEGTMNVVDLISKSHTIPLSQWISDGVVFKYWGDNVDKKIGVRDVRSDHQSSMLHMYSILAGKSRLPSSGLSCNGQVGTLSSISCESLLPQSADIFAMLSTLITLVSRLITEHIDELKQFAKVVPNHISHAYSSQMASKSDVVLVDVLLKNEATHKDMIDIMSAMHGYLGSDYPKDHRILSGGDQLTCERQIGAQRHTMDGNTIEEQLRVLEPVTEDWHCMMCLLTVSELKEFAWCHGFYLCR